MSAYAAIDVGTNSVKLHIAEPRPAGGWRTLVDRAEVTRLGEGLRDSGAISGAAMRRTVDAIVGMVDEAHRHGVAALAAVGTMGLRTARNRADFLRQVESRCGIVVEVISGEEEARLAYLAVRAGLGLGDADAAVVVFDTGGGSTEFTIGRGAHVERQFSLDLGAARLTEAFKLDAAVDEPALRPALDAIAADLGRLDGGGRPDALVGMGGAVTNLVAVQLGLERYDPDAVQGAVLEGREVDRQIELYRTRDAAARQRIAGLQPKRAELILAGACVVRAILAALHAPALRVSDHGLRHGLLLDRFAAQRGSTA